MKETINLILEIMYVICGVISILCGIYALRDQKNEKRIGSAAFFAPEMVTVPLKRDCPP